MTTVKRRDPPLRSHTTHEAVEPPDRFGRGRSKRA